MRYTIYRNFGYSDKVRYVTFNRLEEAIEVAELMVCGKVPLFRKLDNRETLEIRDHVAQLYWKVVGGYTD